MVRKRRFPRFRRFRRKGNNGTWFPTNGTVWTSEGNTYYDASRSDTGAAVGLSKSFGANYEVFAVTQDYTPNPGAAGGFALEQQPSLRDYVEGNDYILKSIVGSCTVFTEEPFDSAFNWSPTASWAYVKAAAGFFVAKASDDDPQIPDLSALEIDPMQGQNIQDPWIWRRTWILANPFNISTFGATGQFEVFDDMANNRKYGDLTGPSIHTKSRRRIRREERLWFVMTWIGWDGDRDHVTGTETQQPGLKFDLDIRIFGKMVKGKNTSAF